MFERLRHWVIYTLGGRIGGFEDLDEAIQFIRDSNDMKRRHEILTLCVKRLFNTIGENDIIRVHDSGHWIHAGKPLRIEEVKMLQAEAEAFQKMHLYKVLKNELRYWSNRKMFIDSVDVGDIVAGKLLVYYIDIVETRIKRMSEGKEK